MPSLVQSAFNSVAKVGAGDQGSSSVKATFTTPTKPGSLVLVCLQSAGGLPINLTMDGSGFTLLQSFGVRDLQMAVWYRANCPSITSISGFSDAYRSLQLRLLEYTGVNQSSPLDKFTWHTSPSWDESGSIDTGPTGTLSQTDELCVAFVANQYTASQVGFTGAFTRIYENVSPATTSSRTLEEWERGRLTVHQVTPTVNTGRQITGSLSTPRRWIAFLATFKGISSGPVKLSCTNSSVGSIAGRGALSCFGALRSGTVTPRTMVNVLTPTARIGPYDYQYRLGGWSGLLIGSDTPFRVESVDGLEGWNIRTSDSDLPRGDGALRGTDLQSARTIVFKVNYDGDFSEIEDQTDQLFRILIPQRDGDWPLIYRHPGRPLRYVNVRPTDLARELSGTQLWLHSQAIALRAADPRHYTVIENRVTIPVTQVYSNPQYLSVNNLGNSPAYPKITVTVPPTVSEVDRIELVNATTNSTFDVRAVMTARSVLVGDMTARVTGAPVSIVTIDGQSKYGAWQFPRDSFRLDPGSNNVYLRTEPAAQPVSCVLSYRDTWSG